MSDNSKKMPVKKVIAKNVFVVVTILMVVALLKLTPYLGGGFSSSLGDGFWRDCTYSITDSGFKSGCYMVTFALPRFSSEEKKFKKVLDEISDRHRKISKEEVFEILGRNPDVIVELSKDYGRYNWTNFGPGIDQQRGVTIHIHKGQLYEILWIQPKRFTLVLNHYVK